MEKIGEIVLNNKIQIMDAFDVIEQFSRIELSNIQPGLWLAYNEEKEAEWGGSTVTQFLMVNQQYFENNPEYENYQWKTEEQIIDIEKGMIGVFNESFTYSENYYNEMDDNAYNEIGKERNYIVCSTPYGEDGCYTFDVVRENENIVALKVNFPQED